MRIVVDTNIVFSALISSSGIIPEIIVSPYGSYKFYASDYLFDELASHKSKLLKASKLSEKEIELAKAKLFNYISVVSLDIIPQEIWQVAEILTYDIDPDDISFVALSIFLDAYLWTGDKVLYNGLQNKGFDKVVMTSNLINPFV